MLIAILQFSRARIEFLFLVWCAEEWLQGRPSVKTKVRLIAEVHCRIADARSSLQLALDKGWTREKPSADHQSPGMAKREIVALLYLEHRRCVKHRLGLKKTLSRNNRFKDGKALVPSGTVKVSGGS